MTFDEAIQKLKEGHTIKHIYDNEPRYFCMVLSKEFIESDPWEIEDKRA